MAEALAGAGTEHEFEYRARISIAHPGRRGAALDPGPLEGIPRRERRGGAGHRERRRHHGAQAREEARRLSEERYARAEAGADGGIWDWDLVSGMFYRSPRNQQITMGRASDSVDVRRVDEWSQSFQLHPDDVAKRDTAIRLHVEGRTPLYEIGYRVRRQDGAYHWVHARGVCTRDASGRALHFAGSTTSIDARKAAEEALRLSEERYALAMEASEEAHFDWNVQTDKIFASAQLKETVGLPADAEYRTRSDMSDECATTQAIGNGSMKRPAASSAASPSRTSGYRVLRGEETRWPRRRWKIFATRRERRCG